MNVLGVTIDSYTINELRTKVRSFFDSKHGHMIVTPNPEMLVAAHTDEYFKEVLNEADLSICDGKGICYMSLGKIPRHTGVDFLFEICALAQEEHKRVFLLGSGSKKIVKKTQEVLQKTFPQLQIVGIHEGIVFEEVPVEKGSNRKKLIYSQGQHDEMIDTIIDAAPDVLFVAFGHSKQEKWIYEQLPHLPSVRVAMGVGGSFDFISGHIKRAPKAMRLLGLEWLWRLVQQPWRIKRIWRAVVVFPFLYIFNK